MESIKNQLTAVGEQMQTSSKNQPTSIATTLNREQHHALFVLINKSRMLNGWTTKTAAELDATIQTWGEMFNHYSIPLESYSELYRLAFDTRQQKLQQGQDVPMMDAALLVSHWTGQNGLEQERRARSQHKALPEHREKVCPVCFGTGSIVLGENRGQVCNHDLGTEGE